MFFPLKKLVDVIGIKQRVQQSTWFFYYDV